MESEGGNFMSRMDGNRFKAFDERWLDRWNGILIIFTSIPNGGSLRSDFISAFTNPEFPALELEALGSKPGISIASTLRCVQGCVINTNRCFPSTPIVWIWVYLLPMQFSLEHKCIIMSHKV